MEMKGIKSVIAELRELEGKASKGPWASSWQCNNSWLIYGPKMPYENADGFLEGDAKLMAVMRNALPQLLEYVEELQQKVDDHTADIMAALSEPCGLDDRVHCTCVPALRARIKELEATCQKK